MLAHVRDVVFPWLKSDLAAKGELFAQAMKDAVFIIPKGSLMVEMVSTIDKLYELIEKEEQKGQAFHDVFKVICMNLCSLKSLVPERTDSSVHPSTHHSDDGHHAQPTTWRDRL